MKIAAAAVAAEPFGTAVDRLLGSGKVEAVAAAEALAVQLQALAQEQVAEVVVVIVIVDQRG